MLTKRMLSGAALVLSMSAALRVAVGQGRPPPATAKDIPPHVPATVPGGEGGVRAIGESGASQAAYFAGLRARDSDVRRRHFAAGIEAARARLRSDPRDPEGLLWLAANLGG